MVTNGDIFGIVYTLLTPTRNCSAPDLSSRSVRPPSALTFYLPRYRPTIETIVAVAETNVPNGI
jgi:hypothetical protein